MRVCKNCGTKNPEGAAFCKKCGYSMVLRTQRKGTSSRSKRESSNTGLTVVMCLVGALAAVLIIGAAILVAIHLVG